MTPAAATLAEALIEQGVMPRQSATDALHVAVATVHDMDVLVTWNCRHLANAEMLGALGRLIRSKGFDSPVICTPEELMGE